MNQKAHSQACAVLHLSIFCGPMCGVAMSSAGADEAVRSELVRFETEWTAAEPHDSPYGIRSVLSLLDLDRPGLEATRAAYRAGRWDAAERELLRYFKTARKYEGSPVKKLSPRDRKAADDALLHVFPGNKAFPPVFRGADIDWRSKAAIDGKTVHDAEWLFQYHRLSWWSGLAKAYGATGDERYFREWRYELVSYARKNLPITRKTPWFIRRGMETYGRCHQHIHALPHMIRSDSFDGRTLRYFLSSFHHQAEHIRKVYARKGNHLLGELAAVFANGVSFPEFKRSPEWIEEALQRFPERMFADVYPDGMNRELVFSYHGMYVRLFNDFYLLANKHGYADRLPEEYHDRLRRMHEIMVYQTFPDWTNCQYGDGWKGKPGAATWLFRAHATKRYPDVPHFEYMATRGARGAPPPHTSRAYPVSGFYFFRSGWKPDAVFMPLKCAEEGEWHNHIDNGTFDLYAFGRNFMIDSGCYVYGSDDPEEKKWREWFRSTSAHQTLTLDGRNIRLKPTFLLWHESDDLVALVVENESYDDLTHRRTVLFMDGMHVLIHDQAIGRAAGRIRTHYQLVPCRHSFDTEAHEVRTAFTDGPNLVVKGFPQGRRLGIEKEEGWISYEYRKREPRPAWSFVIDKSGTEEAVSFLTALVPYRKAPPRTITARVRSEGDAQVYEYRVDGRTRTMTVDPVEKTVTQ